jgi:hypothetical protein
MCLTLADLPAHQASLVARAAIAHANAAVLIWKCRHGTYPVSLQQAMVNVPKDPFDLKPIRYRRENGGFVVYSVGKTGQYAGQPGSHEESVRRVAADGTGIWK